MVNHNENKPATIFMILNRITDVLAGISTAAISLVVLWQVFGRVLGIPAPWTEEVTRFLFIWLVFLGIGIGFRKVESARVTILLQYAPKFIKKLSVWIYAIASVGFFIFMTFYGFELVTQQINIHEKSAALLFPMWIIGLSVPVSGLLGIFNTVQSLIYDKEIIEKGGV
ncbi:TRAP transporter small permease [Bacillus timonensis]|uniref:TRAP transporter small permease n=1 Tax=Bacillus timonensis TaxID=1033734 RepID=UPI000289F14C|nr:TRAP transporter small permease [Bacillus timonensis]